MSQLRPPAAHVAMLFFLLVLSSAVSGAETGTFLYADALRIGAESQEGDARDGTQEKQTSAYGWKVPPPETPDWRGVGRDTAYFLAYQVVIVGLLYVSPESVSGWTKEDKEELKWAENVKNPHRDSDENYINYLLHPYWGATYYTRGRERGLDRAQSFLFSTALSTLYEFGVEAIFEKPSYQDLWATPVIGSLIGEFVFAPIREHVRAQPGDLDWADKTILFFTDPLGVIGAESDRLLGVQTTVRLQAFQPTQNARSTALSTASYSPADGTFRQAAPAWGVQLQVRW